MLVFPRQYGAILSQGGTGGPPPSGFPISKVAELTLTKSGSQTITSTETTMTWQTELLDNGWGWSSGDIVVPAGVKLVTLNFITFQSGSLITAKYGRIRVNGTEVYARFLHAQFWSPNNMRHVFPVTPGDTITVTQQTDSLSHSTNAARTFVSVIGWDY